MSRIQSQTTPPLPTVAADRYPFAEELLLLDIAASWKGTDSKPFPLLGDLDQAMRPHQGAAARTACEKFGWLVRATGPKQVPTGARTVSPAGREIMRQPAAIQHARAELERRIAECEARAKQFKAPIERTDLPRLRKLHEWLVGPAEPEKADSPKAPAANPEPRTAKGRGRRAGAAA